MRTKQKRINDKLHKLFNQLGEVVTEMQSETNHRFENDYIATLGTQAQTAINLLQRWGVLEAYVWSKRDNKHRAKLIRKSREDDEQADAEFDLFWKQAEKELWSM